MKLDRNITHPRRGKYALIKLRESWVNRHIQIAASAAGMNVEVEPHSIDFGNTADTDFFVIRLKDKYAAAALFAYAQAARHDDPEYANEILDLVQLAEHHPNKRKPD